MIGFGKVLVAASALSLMLAMTGCDDEKKEEQTSSAVSVKNSSSVTNSRVALKKYEFPEFMRDLEAGRLSEARYRSFDPDEYCSAVTDQPFEGYECETLIDDVLYVYSNGENVGLLDLDGEVLEDAQGCSDIELVSDGVISLEYKRGEGVQTEYKKFDNNGNLSDYTPPEFETGKFAISDAYSADPKLSDKVFKALYKPDGTPVMTADHDLFFDSIEWIDPEEYTDDDRIAAACKAVRDDTCYIITFDYFGNYTFYESAYAKIALKVGDEFGECYINSQEDYSEFINMYYSFGQAASPSAPSKDQSLDFIQITTGLNSGSVTQITMSPDGYCLTDNLSSGEDEPLNKYFTYLDKEDFVDLVLWVDQVLSQEYRSEQ